MPVCSVLTKSESGDRIGQGTSTSVEWTQSQTWMPVRQNDKICS